MSFELPKLLYAYDSLEPYIDSCTMEIHHTKHHGTYTNNLNKAIEATRWDNYPIEDLLRSRAIDVPAIRNNAGGFYNHSLFWRVLTPPNQSNPSQKLSIAIDEEFNSFESFKEKFQKSANSYFGSGWVWLCVCSKNRKLFITSSSNQDNPLMPFSERLGVPILGLDIWEHAYYLKYQNKRYEYINSFWQVVNWEKVSKNYEKI